MTPHDAAELLLGYISGYNQLMYGYIGVLSAFLVMCFAAADKLNRMLCVLVLSLFSLVCIMLIFQMNLIRNDMSGMYQYLLSMKDSEPESLIWFGTNPNWAVPVLTVITNLVSFGGFLGCIAFFFYQRSTSSSKKAA